MKAWLVHGSIGDALLCYPSSAFAPTYPVLSATLAHASWNVCREAVAHVYQMTGRDIKPDNIMLDKWLTLKIGDFGFARAGHQERGFKSFLVCVTFGPVDEDVLLLFGMQRHLCAYQQTDG